MSLTKCYWIISCFSFFNLLSIAVKAQDVGNKKMIEKLLIDFQNAIQQKDSTQLVNLFFQTNTPIIGLMSKKTELFYRKKNPAFQGLSVSEAKQFVTEIMHTKAAISELIIHPKIALNEKIATVLFDYAYTIDAEIYQWGKESWSLVFAEGQWFIANINYTIHKSNIEIAPNFYKGSRR